MTTFDAERHSNFGSGASAPYINHSEADTTRALHHKPSIVRRVQVITHLEYNRVSTVRKRKPAGRTGFIDQSGMSSVWRHHRQHYRSNRAGMDLSGILEGR